MPILLPIVVALSLNGSFPASDRMRSGAFEAALRPSDEGSAGAGQSDLDGDGVDDCWTVTSQWGSGFGAMTVTVRPACGRAAYGLDGMSSFGELLSQLHPGPAGLPRAFVDGVSRGIYGVDPVCRDTACAAIDPAFAWLLEAARANAGRRDGWIHFTPRPRAGRPFLPADQVIALHGPHTAELAARLDPAEPNLAELRAHEARGELVAFVGFSGAWVGSVLLPGARCGHTQLWTTEHGVVAEDLARHAWQWIYLSTGCTKLRWPSIDRATCAPDGTISVFRHNCDEGPERITIRPAEGRWRSEPIER